MDNPTVPPLQPPKIEESTPFCVFEYVRVPAVPVFPKPPPPVGFKHTRRPSEFSLLFCIQRRGEKKRKKRTSEINPPLNPLFSVRAHLQTCSPHPSPHDTHTRPPPSPPTGINNSPNCAQHEDAVRPFCGEAAAGGEHSRPITAQRFARALRLVSGGLKGTRRHCTGLRSLSKGLFIHAAAREEFREHEATLP